MRRILMLPMLPMLPVIPVLLASLTGCDDTGITVSRAPYDLAAVPDRHDFGSTAIGAAVTQELRVQNLGSGSAEVSAIALGGSGAGNFLLDASWTGVIGGGATQGFSVTFAPTDEGWFEETLLLQILDRDTVDVFEVRLRGAGVRHPLRAWPEVVDLGPVAEGGTASRDVSLENLTDNPVQLDDAVFGGDDEGFSFVPPDDLPGPPWILEGGQILQAQVVHESAEGIAQQAELTLSGDGDGWDLDVEVRANLCEGSGDAGWDQDGDGYTPCGGDCDDGEEASHPGAVEVGDATDNDCDGLVDEGTDLYDDDGDGYAEVGGDCDDADPNTWPSAPELPDGRDNDCDGEVDEGTGSHDGDGDGWTGDAGDCDPSNPTVYPGAPELEDALDNDCDGTRDEGTTVYDDDGDGYCENSTGCLGGSGFLPGDCNDGDPSVSPLGIEVSNGIDDDCDGVVDDGTEAVDSDGDGYTPGGGDCDDSDPDTFPGAPEQPDQQDNDCDGAIDEGTVYWDDDGDGFSELGGDCNDGSPLIYPGAPEDLGGANPDDGDGVDNDCDGLVDEGTNASDDDGDGFSEQGGDCDDTDEDIAPARYDPPGDGVDADCDGND